MSVEEKLSHRETYEITSYPVGAAKAGKAAAVTVARTIEVETRMS